MSRTTAQPVREANPCGAAAGRGGRCLGLLVVAVSLRLPAGGSDANDIEVKTITLEGFDGDGIDEIYTRHPTPARGRNRSRSPRRGPRGFGMSQSMRSNPDHTWPRPTPTEHEPTDPPSQRP